MRSDLDDLCTCGHQRRHHHGADDGPCLAVATNKATGKPLIGSVCPCSTFQLPASVKPAPKPRPARRARKAAPVGGDCWLKSCNDPATVILQRDGRPYCRPHGLAAALRLPRSEVRPLPGVLSGEPAS